MWPFKEKEVFEDMSLHELEIKERNAYKEDWRARNAEVFVATNEKGEECFKRSFQADYFYFLERFNKEKDMWEIEEKINLLNRDATSSSSN